MKTKIRLRLFFYFVIALTAFSLLIGAIFTLLFSRYNMDIHKKDMEARATQIAQYLSYSSQQGMGRGMGGYGMYLRFIDEIAMSDVWIVDPNLEQIVRGQGQMGIEYKDLPENAEKVIASALSGKTSFSENFSMFLEAPSITAATPIVLADGSVAGAVLLHARLESISQASSTGLWLLVISMAIAVVISFGIAGALSSRFTKPLEMMKQAAIQISEGNFGVQTKIAQSDELGELAKAMDAMAVRLDRASKESEKLDKLRRDFVSNISHELRTPVTVLRGSLEALCEGVVAEPGMVNEYHGQMLAETLHLERLVSDLLDLSKLQNTDFKMDLRPVSLKEIADDAVHSMEKIAHKKNIEFSVKSDEGVYRFVGDYGRLRQMFTIVLSNSIKFSPEGSVVSLSLSQTNDGFDLSVSDTGCGISPDDLPHVFDRFYKQQSEQNKNGTGLGLAIAKQIAERQGVSIKIASEINKGTTVTFSFPSRD